MRNKIVNTILIILISLGCLFSYLAFKEYQPIMKSVYQNDSIKEVGVKESHNPIDRVIDFDSLKSINPDIIGWIYIPDSSIDYPILQGETDQEYLYKNSNGNDSVAGSITTFADTSLTKGNVFLYGHNMAQNHMFGELKKYILDDFRKEHPKFYIYTEEKNMELDVYSIFVANENDDIYRHTFEVGSFDHMNKISMYLNHNLYTDIELKKGADWLYNQTFTLLSCFGEQGTEKRLLVNGLVQKEKYILQK